MVEVAPAPTIASTWIVVPAYNENQQIAATIRGLRSRFKNIVVVDDHSSDATGEAALAAGAHVCRHPLNLGQGAALATGIAYALSQGGEFIVTFDADGQHDPADAERMIQHLLDTRSDVVLGSRFLGSAPGMTRGKRNLLKAAIAFTRLTTGLRLTDTHNGLRVLNRKAAASIQIRQNRMAHASELLSEIARLGLTYTEAPCSIVYTSYSRRKGQRMSGAFAVLCDLTIERLQK